MQETYTGKTGEINLITPHRKGFTLLELMIVVVIGVAMTLVIAALPFGLCETWLVLLSGWLTAVLVCRRACVWNGPETLHMSTT